MADTLEPVRLPPTLPLGFGSLDAPCPGQEVPCSLPQASGELDSSGRRGANGHYVPSQEWESGNVPGQGTGLWGKCAQKHPFPFPCCSEPCHPLPGPVGRWQGLPQAPGMSVHTHTEYTISHIHRYPHSPACTEAHTCLQALSEMHSHIYIHMTIYSAICICTHITHRSEVRAHMHTPTHTHAISSFPHT